jgi:hypothetical protein
MAHGDRNVGGASTPPARRVDVTRRHGEQTDGTASGCYAATWTLLLESRVWVRPFTIQIFVVVPRPQNTASRTKCRAKIHSHSTKTKREFMRRVNILENPSENLAQFSIL